MLVALLSLAAVSVRAQDPQIRETRPNVKVLKDLHESELFLEMNFVADALGVHCDYCHVKNDTKWVWADDSKPTKAKGRQMMTMVAGLNASSFNGTTRVTCFTCHRGSLEPARLVPLPPIESAERTGQRPPETLPTAQQIIDRYLAAIGAHRDDPVKAMRITGVIERSENRKDTFELSILGEENARITVTTADGIVEQTLEGKSSTLRAKDKVTELPPAAYERFRRSIAMYAPIKVRDSVEQMKVTGTEVIDGRKTYVVQSGPARKLYFDATSSLLVRDLRITETVFVPLLDQIDYSDYRAAGGVKMPFAIRTSNVAPYDTATRRIREMKFE